jgi:hypothetical protein
MTNSQFPVFNSQFSFCRGRSGKDQGHLANNLEIARGNARILRGSVEKPFVGDGAPSHRTPTQMLERLEAVAPGFQAWSKGLQQR